MKKKMSEFLKKCDKFREIVNGGLRTRDNDDVEVPSSSTKRRKFDFSENSASPAISVTTVQIPTNSQCSNWHESGEVTMKSILKSLDLKAEEFETDNSVSFNGGFSENFKPSEHCGDSEDMESSSTTTKKSSSAGSTDHRKPPSAAKVPPEAEIEEFFAAAEKCEQKRFAEKYNYDIVKDVPLEGRYQWVSLKR